MNNKPILPPKLAAWILRHTAVPEERFPVAQNLDEDFSEYVSLKGKFKARIMYWHHVLKTVFIIFCYKTYWGYSMFKSYFITAIRNMLRQKGYSFINIMGLAIGIACCLLIVLYVGFEMSYDSYHKDADRIYRIGTHIDRPGEKRTVTYTCVPFAPYVRQNFPQVEQAARIVRRVNPLVKSGDNVFFEDSIIYADKEILDIFTIPFIKGNPEQAISNPGTIVISRNRIIF